MLNKSLLVILISFFALDFIAHAETIDQVILKSNKNSRLSTPLTGSYITIINNQQIGKFANKNIAEIISTYSGIQTRSLYNGVENLNTSIDLRGFGEASKSNSLILVNGRILNDLDSGAVNFSSINLDLIERIEIIRGSSASTIYGPGAIGGAINIITKSARNIEDQFNFSFASYNKLEGQVLLKEKIKDNHSFIFSGKIIESDTFRDQGIIDQQSILTTYNYDNSKLNAFIDLSVNKKDQFLPGPRIIGGHYNYHLCNLLSSSSTARNVGGSLLTNADSCNSNKRQDYSNIDNEHIKLGLNFDIDQSLKVYTDTLYKKKVEKVFYAANENTVATPSNSDRFINTVTDGNELNLRIDKTLNTKYFSDLFTIGFDHYHTFYETYRYRNENEDLGQSINADQKSQGVYFQNSINFFNLSSLLSTGFRYQRTEFQGRGVGNQEVVGFSSAVDILTYNERNENIVYNIGLEKKINLESSFFVGYSKGFRSPNIDERTSSPNSQSFILKDQTSKDIELGIRIKKEKTSLIANIFSISSKNEIQYNQRVNINLDPIKRKGLNLDLEYKINNKDTLRTSLSYVEAKFTTGTLSPGTGSTSICNNDNTTYCSNSSTWQNLMGGGNSYSLAGKLVPLVAPVKYYAVYERKLKKNIFFEIELNYTDKMFASNDQENIEPKIPDYFLINTKLQSNKGPYNFMVGINNIFDKTYYDYAVSSTSHDDNHYGTQEVYPLAGRNFFINFEYSL